MFRYKSSGASGAIRSFLSFTSLPNIYGLAIWPLLPNCNTAKVACGLRTASTKNCASRGDKPNDKACFADHTLPLRSEEHTSELQSHLNLVCRLLLEKKKKKHTNK